MPNSIGFEDPSSLLFTSTQGEPVKITLELLRLEITLNNTGHTCIFCSSEDRSLLYINLLKIKVTTDIYHSFI